ncbi:MAG: type II toxin-antitoxin system YafQ family toxin [Lachnospiraceae bacterium]|nr:type II toxin-antitoxin system YafQ family toxin [Lachnospiraceae bacterium]MCI9135115.1 type II toxin-antitoxin system YafQ family toxin [Lachnospiraceae bacterium]
MLKIRYSTKFKKDYKMIIKRGYNPKLLENVLNILCTEQPLPSKYKDHQLSGNYEGHRECHISPDWLLIYKIEQSILTLTLTRTGTHSDLF